MYDPNKMIVGIISYGQTITKTVSQLTDSEWYSPYLAFNDDDVTEDFIEAYKEKILHSEKSFTLLCDSPHISLKYILKNIDLYNFHIGLTLDRKFPIKILDKYSSVFNPVDWSTISKRYNLPIWFIDKYKDKLNWRLISKKKLTYSFIKKYADKYPWVYAVQYNVMSARFMNYFSSYLRWELVFTSQNLSMHFIETHMQLIKDKSFRKIAIVKYQRLTEKYMEKYLDYFGINNLTKYQTFSRRFIEKHKHDISWYMLDKYQSFSYTEKFIKRYRKYIRLSHLAWPDIINTSAVSPEFLEKNKKYFSDIDRMWSYYCMNQKNLKYILDDKFIEEHKQDLDWKAIAELQKLPAEFINKYLDYINIDCLKKNKYINLKTLCNESENLKLLLELNQ